MTSSEAPSPGIISPDMPVYRELETKGSYQNNHIWLILPMAPDSAHLSLGATVRKPLHLEHSAI
jgi:hypothetical protein